VVSRVFFMVVLVLFLAIGDGEVECPTVSSAGVRRKIPRFFIPQQYLLISCLFQKQTAISDFAY